MWVEIDPGGGQVPPTLSPSVRGCGLKSFSCAIRVKIFVVTLRARVWVEIVDRCQQASQKNVTLRARVWVEIGYPCDFSQFLLGSPSVRGCGLKFHLFGRPLSSSRSPSVRGCGLKSRRSRPNHRSCQSPSVRGCGLKSAGRRPCPCSPRGHPPCEGVG